MSYTVYLREAIRIRPGNTIFYEVSGGTLNEWGSQLRVGDWVIPIANVLAWRKQEEKGEE